MISDKVRSQGFLKDREEVIRNTGGRALNNGRKWHQAAGECSSWAEQRTVAAGGIGVYRKSDELGVSDAKAAANQGSAGSSIGSSNHPRAVGRID